jgi:mevalonate kinase
LKKFSANGKLLLTGEYLILDGAFSLAMPCDLGQSLHFSPNDSNIIKWNSFDQDNQQWFKASFNIKNFELIQTSNNEAFEWLIKVIKNALNLSKKENFGGGEINTYLEFPNNWGLGSSSTILSNIAQLFNIDPFDLHFKCSNGSGYDIACAKSDGPITYQIKDNNPIYSSVTWHPEYSEELFFIHLNIKQNSNKEVIRYKQNKKKMKEVSKKYLI